MNTSQVSGITKNIVGRFQERAGKFFGNKEQQMTGRQKQSMGAAEKNLGDARELIKNALKQMQRSKQAFQIQSGSPLIRPNRQQEFSAHTNSLAHLKKLN